MDARLLSKTFLLVFFIALSNPLFISRVLDIGVSFSLLIFLFIWLVSVISLFLLAFQSYSHTKGCLTALIILSSAMSLNYYQVTKQALEFYELETMLHAAGNWADALSTFDGLWYGFLISLMGLIAILVPSKKTLPVNKPLLLAPTLVICTLLISILYLRQGNGTKAMPAQYTSIAYYSLIIKDQLLNPKPDGIPEVTIPHSGLAFEGDLIIVMDESIRGDFLDFNNRAGVSTTLLNKRTTNMVNFGIASSATNCSDTSNLSLRRGVTRNNYLSDKDNNPSVWQFAKNAGYRTVYLDAQLTDGQLGNHMTNNEKTHIDMFNQITRGRAPIMEKDNILAQQLNKLLNNDTREFIYINKMGAHFPYEGKYPRETAVYAPVMDNVIFNKSYPEAGELPHPDDYSKLMRLKFINSYKNALSWNISQFFTTLNSVNKTHPYVLIYTSDHGQSFHDDGREGYGTHCSIKDTDPEEGIVPLLVFSNDSKQLARFKQAQSLNKDSVSHFNITPTLHDLMGYDLSTLVPQEKTLFEPLDSVNQRFLSKYFVRFGSTPIWNSIDMKGRRSLKKWDIASH